jgi:hypothetical protein
VTKEQIDNNFRYHPPTSSQQEKYVFLRDEAKELAYKINELCPDSREKSLALTKLEEAIMWANASIARNEEGQRTGSLG